jgi:hypothetical protein
VLLPIKAMVKPGVTELPDANSEQSYLMVVQAMFGETLANHCQWSLSTASCALGHVFTIRQLRIAPQSYSYRDLDVKRDQEN